MPRMAPELAAIEVKRLSHPGEGRGNVLFPVGGVSGLGLQITPRGARSWILRATIGEIRREIGLGSYPEVSLSAARERAREAKEQIRQGIDPIEHKKAIRADLIATQKRGLTFADAVDRYCAAKLDEFGNEKHKKQWRASLDRYAAEPIGDMLVSDLNNSDILRVLEPIWNEKTETARKLRGRIENVLDWARVAGHRTGDNPARWRGNLDNLLPKPSRIANKEHWPAVALDEVADWFAALRKREGIAAQALQFLVLTAVRSGNVRQAEWSEINKAARVWVIPAEKMKGVGGQKKEHRVPLTDAALKILEAMPRRADSSYIFAAARGGPLSDMSVSKVMRTMQGVEVRAGSKGWLDSRSGKPAVPHGLRSTFRDWAGELTDYPRDMAEIALAHTVGSEVERAYRRADMLEKRREMMADWARYLRA